MNYYFRVDASTLIGSGHVMRCLTLAQVLQKSGYKVIFICREYPGHLIETIKAQGFVVKVLPFHDKKVYQEQKFSNDYGKWLWLTQEQDVHDILGCDSFVGQNCLIIDHYGLDAQAEMKLRAVFEKIMVIDDLANRRHDCDILLDQNFYLDFALRYQNLCPTHCIQLLGPQYALIRPEFLEARNRRQTFAKLKNIVVYMGGADPKNITEAIVLELLKLKDAGSYHIDVVVGVVNPYKERISALCQAHSFLHYHDHPVYYLDLLIQADLAIAAGGASSYERCIIGLPSIVFSIAENQDKICSDLASWGAQMHLKDLLELGVTVQGLTEEKLAMMNQRALALFSNYQGVNGVFNAL